MIINKTWSNYGRQIFILRRIRSLGIVLLSILVVGVSIFVISRVNNGTRNERRELLRIWNDGDYEQAYEFSKAALSENPVDNFLLTINGFSAYQLGISQINNQNTLNYINESIFSLRKALITSKDEKIYYVLGKAYGYKGREYSELAVKYLEMANNLSYDAQDIPEYLGLAYAAHGDYRSSVAAFTQAFVPGKPPSDNLLLSIARSYMAMEEYNMAFSYLQQCIEISPDSKSVILARILLAEVYKLTEDYDNAQTQYLSIIDDSGENAEVHYQLGEIYNLKGDTTRARAEWRLAYRQDPAHAKARARLNI
ncbi:MAG: tetratricopeptide repeat protein [Treponema sp.]|jgi:tetratricopeptide (TPR) repeat protein|nr:tetratricopeptide repeat protein [Treponema sp.]